MAGRETIPARGGRALRLAAGESVAVINTHGTQVVDTWAFVTGDMDEWMSMEHSRVESGALLPPLGAPFVTNRRRAILTRVADTSPGVHDTLMAACDRQRYARLGCEGHHDNCADNMVAALAALGIAAAHVPSPLNLFMNIPVHADGGLDAAAPLGAPGEEVVLRAEIDCVAVFSACPQDMTPINGPARQPTEAHLRRIPAV